MHDRCAPIGAPRGPIDVAVEVRIADAARGRPAAPNAPVSGATAGTTLPTSLAVLVTLLAAVVTVLPTTTVTGVTGLLKPDVVGGGGAEKTATPLTVSPPAAGEATGRRSRWSRAPSTTTGGLVLVGMSACSSTRDEPLPPLSATVVAMGAAGPAKQVVSEALGASPLGWDPS